MSTIDVDSPADSRAWFRTERNARVMRFIAGGEWVVRDAARLDGLLAGLTLGDASEAEIDGSAISRLDSAGAWLLLRTKRAMEKAGKRVKCFTLPEIYTPLIDTIEKEHVAPPVVMERRHGPPGAASSASAAARSRPARQGYRMLGYLGRFAIEWAEAMLLPRGNLRFAALMRSGRGSRHQRAAHRRPSSASSSASSWRIRAPTNSGAWGGDLHHQPARRRHPARARRPRHRDHHRRALGFGLHPPRSARCGSTRRSTRLQTIGINTFDVLVLPRVLGSSDRAAVPDLLRRRHGDDRRRGDVLFRPRHHLSPPSCASSTRRCR